MSQLQKEIERLEGPRGEIDETAEQNCEFTNPRKSTTVSSPWSHWVTRRPFWFLAALVILALAPFIAKPFSIDDPLSIWIARHIQSHPLDPYGFNANWGGTEAPMYRIEQNPPLVCYYLALVGAVLGWSEWALHGAFLLPSIAAILGTFRLARRFCCRPAWAAVLTLFAPVFLVSSTTIMCDVSMLALWVWSLIFWFDGVEKRSNRSLALAAVLVTLASLTKYFGISLIPLVAAWSIAKKRPARDWLAWLAVPLVTLVIYQFASSAVYGRGLLTGAVKVASLGRESTLSADVYSVIAGLAFTGGCLAAAVFFTPLLWGRRALFFGTVVSLFALGALCYVARNSFPVPLSGLESVQLLFWAAGGASVLALAVADVHLQKDADSLLLACWLVGTFFFATFCNWAVNGRSILPMAIPAGILVMRRLQQREKEGVVFSWKRLLIPTFAGAGLAIWVSAADCIFAQVSKTAAQNVCAGYKNDAHKLWFQGHWGFQYYMEQQGAAALDEDHININPGDYIAAPSHNSNVDPISGSLFVRDTIALPIPGPMTTMNMRHGSGFYASVLGPLPFAVGSNWNETVKILVYEPGEKKN